ncbi:MAG TPA: radical SAM protein, partial [Cyclobacteriaceae bacterium]|nr:radical SAM protein [Cyclobacteriaceae bacterium]
MLQRIATRLTHRIYEMPVLVLMPHSRCNCRCVMCDIWKANSEKREISTEDLATHIEAFKKLRVKRIAFSGGEALMHTNLWKFCDQLNSIGTKISLLSTGLSLKANASEIVTHVDDVIVSLDGSKEIHNRIRNIPSAYEKLAEGVSAIKKINPAFRVTGRSVIQKLNFKDFENIIESAKALGLDQISFLPADVSSSAFNRPQEWEGERKEEIALSLDEANELESILKNSFQRFKKEYQEKFIAESPEKMLAVVQQYRAYYGKENFPKRHCNAPWVSAVIEPNGDVLPCFFHRSYGNIYNEPFEKIINSSKAVSFRKTLNMDTDPI